MQIMLRRTTLVLIVNGFWNVTSLSRSFCPHGTQLINIDATSGKTLPALQSILVIGDKTSSCCVHQYIAMMRLITRIRGRMETDMESDRFLDTSVKDTLTEIALNLRWSTMQYLSFRAISVSCAHCTSDGMPIRHSCHQSGKQRRSVYEWLLPTP